jgi:hypothetical protein
LFKKICFKEKSLYYFHKKFKIKKTQKNIFSGFFRWFFLGGFFGRVFYCQPCSEVGDAVYMSSSSELQLLTVAASRVGFCKAAKGTVVVPPENRRTGSEEPSAAATETDRQADLQNRQNEREAEQNGTQARASPRYNSIK